MRHLPSSFCGLNSSRASGWSSRIKLSMLRNATTKRNDEKLETPFFCKAASGGGQNVDVMFALAIAHTSSSSSSSIPLLLLLALSAVQSHALFQRSFLSRSTGTRHIYLVLFVVLFILSSALLCFTLLHFCLFPILPLSLSSSTSTFIPPIHEGSGPIHCA